MRLLGIISIWVALLGLPARGQDTVIEHDEAKDIARRNGWLIREETPTGVIELAAIVNGTPWYNTTFNSDAADSISTDDCLPGGLSGLGLDGAGVTLGVWDAAGVRLTHQEFGSRANQADGQSITHQHSTHVAGTMIASGVVAAAAGMSPSASLDCYDWTYDTTEMGAAAAAGLRVSSHSYGFVQGWYYDSVNDEYWWYGDRNVSNDEDYRFGLYGGYSYGLDLIAADHPYYLICRSAGNDRSDVPPTGPEAVHFHMIPPYNVEWESGIDFHASDGDYDSITTRNTAKNILTVGAVDDAIGGYSGPGSVVMSSFSGWGPCDDGRIKPDIVANGINLYSTDDATDSAYATLSGTSMAAPSVAGSLGLLIEHWRATHPSESDMLSSTLKGLALHTADEAGSANGPDYEYGWGLMNTLAAVNAISEDVAEPLTVSEWDFSDGDWLELLATTDGTSSELRATICWTDPPGPWQSGEVDPVTKILVNDLDIRIDRASPPTTYLPWTLDPANPGVAAATGDNDTDNVEQVIVYSPGADTYTLTVTHKGTLSGGSQAFSAIITGATQIQLSNATTSGYATTSMSSTALPGVQVSATNSGDSDVTDATGYYEMVLRLGGSEVLTPCGDGWVFQPSSHSYNPVNSNLSAEDFAGTFVLDVDPAVTGDEFLGVGDLSLFAASWLQSVPPGDPNHDFDCDGTVGVGDFSYFATGWLKSVFDPTIQVPPCHVCAGGVPGPVGDVQLELRLVAVTVPSAEDQTQQLPESVKWIGVGQTYYVEMWVRDMDGTSPGVTSAYADVVFEGGRSDAQAVLPSELFGAFAGGSIEGSAVRQLGGSVMAADVGTDGWWARAAGVEVNAIASGRAQYELDECATGFGAYGRGVVQWENIERFGVTVGHVGLNTVVRSQDGGK